MVIIEPRKFSSREEYIQSLSKRARHEHTLVHKRNADLTYRETLFDKDKISYFMELWGRQLVRGKPIQWAYPLATVENWAAHGELIVLEAAHKNGPTLAMHFLKREDGFWEAQPPMWDKATQLERHLGTYMWFHMVFWGIENGVDVINFGGGIDEWREMIRRRKEFKNPLYKWRFIPQDVKRNPDLQPDYKIITQYEKRILIHGNI